MKSIFDPENLNSLYRYALSLSGHEAHAYDLLQDALERYIKLDKTIEDPMFYTRKIIRNRFIDQLRAENRFPLESISETDEFIVDMDLQNLEDIAISQQTLEIIWQQIKPLERELLHLWAVDELTAQEIAEHLESPRGTVLSRIHRLRKKIVSLLDDDQDSHGEVKS